MKYREGIKYLCAERFAVYVGLLGYAYSHKYMSLNDGWLIIEEGYGSDGATGVSDVGVVAFFAHDALCQSMRLGLLPRHRRKYVDDVYQQLCWECGMSRARAWVRRKGLKWFGAGASKAENERKVIKAPWPRQTRFLQL